jgi:hypothetical protein
MHLECREKERSVEAWATGFAPSLLSNDNNGPVSRPKPSLEKKEAVDPDKGSVGHLRSRVRRLLEALRPVSGNDPTRCVTAPASIHYITQL